MVYRNNAGDRNNAGRLGFYFIYLCVLRNTLAGSKIVVSMCRTGTVNSRFIHFTTPFEIKRVEEKSEKQEDLGVREQVFIFSEEAPSICLPRNIVQIFLVQVLFPELAVWLIRQQSHHSFPHPPTLLSNVLSRFSMIYQQLIRVFFFVPCRSSSMPP